MPASALLKKALEKVTKLPETTQNSIARTMLNEISSKIHIRHYQVVQEKRNELMVFVVEDKGFSSTDSEIISNSLKEHIVGEMEITVAQVDDIPLTESGKRRSVISKLKVGLD